jgi:hypothetical protein
MAPSFEPRAASTERVDWIRIDINNDWVEEYCKRFNLLSSKRVAQSSLLHWTTKLNLKTDEPGR